MNGPAYLELSKIELSKILMLEFWHNYVKLKFGEKGKMCYIDTDSLIVYIKKDGVYKDIAEDIENRLNS